ncbi:MAG TPA: AfsR/SARP family transcriptional regulator [Pseudonocardiaceae bacterium]|nr:AfsR/SARP family transcriptional regulator [Pseudonocardiaceae bacterium]
MARLVVLSGSVDAAGDTLATVRLHFTVWPYAPVDGVRGWDRSIWGEDKSSALGSTRAALGHRRRRQRHSGAVRPPADTARGVADARQPNRALDEIVEVVWEGTPPAAADRTIRVYVARLRQVLGPSAGARILTRNRGYLCRVDEDEFDLLHVETLCRQARSASSERSWSNAADLLADALAQWRGAPLADIPSERLRARECPRLDHLRQQTIEDTIDARMHLDHHQQLIPYLRELTDDQPLREHLHAQLMRALARSGRCAEALDAYRRAHRILADQLGIGPGPELRDLHQRILAGDEEQPAPDKEAAHAPIEAGPVARLAAGSDFVVPRQLPAGSPTLRSDAVSHRAGVPDASRA